MPEFETPSGYLSNLLGRVLNSTNEDTDVYGDSASQSSYRRMGDSDSDVDDRTPDPLSATNSASSHVLMDSAEEDSGSLSGSSGELESNHDEQSDTESIKNLPPASKRNLKEFRKVFADGPISPEKEKLYKVYSCALSKEILYQGRMYVTSNYICFNSRIFNVTNKFCIPFKDITLIEPRRMISIFPNGIEVGTLDGKRFVFASFANRNSAMNFMRQLRTSREFNDSDGSNSLSRSSSSNAVSRRGGSAPSISAETDASTTTSENVTPEQNAGYGRSRSSTASTQSSGVRAVKPPAAATSDGNSPSGAGDSSGHNLKPNASSGTSGTASLTSSGANTDKGKPLGQSHSNSNIASLKSQPNSGSTVSKSSSSSTALQQTCDAFDFFTLKKSNGSPNFMTSSRNSTPTPAPAPVSRKPHNGEHRDENKEAGASTPASHSAAPNSSGKRSKWPINNLGPEEHPKTYLPDAHDNEKVLCTETIKAPPGVVANILAGNDTAWLKHFLMDVEKNRDLTLLPAFPALQSGSERKYEYIKPLSGPVGPKQTRCKCTEKIEHWDFGSYIELLTTTLTPDVPAGSSFTTQTRAIIAWGDNNTTVIRLGTWLEWSGKTWLKVAIEKGAVDGQTSYCKLLVAELTKKINTKSSVTDNEPSPPETANDGDSPKIRKEASEARTRPSKRSETSQKAADAIAAWERACIYLACTVLVLFVMVIYLWIKGRRTVAQPENAHELFRIRQELELWQWLDERQHHETIPRRSISDADIKEAISVSEKKLSSLKASLCL